MFNFGLFLSKHTAGFMCMIHDATIAAIGEKFYGVTWLVKRFPWSSYVLYSYATVPSIVNKRLKGIRYYKSIHCFEVLNGSHGTTSRAIFEFFRQNTHVQRMSCATL